MPLYYLFQADVTLENRKGEFEFASSSNEVSVPDEMTKTVEVCIYTLLSFFSGSYVFIFLQLKKIVNFV